MKHIIEQDIQSYLDVKQIKLNFKVDYSSFENYHYQSSFLFSLLKIEKFNKEELLNYLLETNNYEQVSLTGKGFISFKLKPEKFTNLIIKKEKKKVIVDYCGVNVAKKMHIGHIRSMFSGDFIVRLNEFIGNEVVIYNHIGDWGNQFGFLINFIIKNNLKDFDNSNLTDYYKKAYLLYCNDKEFKEESDNVAFLLQNNKDKNIYSIWEKCVNTSLNDLDFFLEKFNLKINKTHVKGESFYSNFCNDIINDLLEKKVAIKDSDGSVFVETNGDKVILKKSNGNYLYSTYDLAAIKWRVEQHNPNEIVYVVDKRQSSHFKNIFEISKMAGYSTNVNLIHVAFGTIVDKNGKPLKTKEGESLYLDDLLNQGFEIIKNNEHIEKIPDNVKTEILNKTLIGGLKFFDLKFSKQNDYFFNWDNIFNFSGNSAPYIQNAYVRIDSILFKKFDYNYPIIEIDVKQINSDEHILLFNICKLYEIILQNNSNYQSNMITNQLIDVCSLFHSYYEKNKIIGSETEINKLAILLKLKKAIEDSCSILGVETYNCIKK